MRLASFRGLALAVLLVAGIVSLGVAQPPARGEKKSTPDDKKPSSDALTPPPGTIVAVYDKLADALTRMPNAVLLSPEKYQELLDEIARLRKQLLDRPRPRTPGKCVLKGKVESGLVQLQAQFEFATEKPGEFVRLGCGLAQATGVTLDGGTPSLLGGRGRSAPSAKGRTADEETEGFTVQVEKPGNHQLTLDLVLALSARPAGQGCTLDLPRAAMTSLELDLPDGVRDVRVGGKTPAEALLTLKGKQLSGNLGVLDRLDLGWKSGQASSASAVLAADGVIQVQIDHRQVAVAATLTLRVLAGQTRQWRLLLPRGAELKAVDAEERVARIESSEQKQASLRTIHLKEASADPLTVAVTCTQPALKPGVGKATPLGPFTVLGAVRQSGSVLVGNAVADWRLEFAPHGDLTRRGASDEEMRRFPSLAAAFRYGPGGGPLGDAGLSASWLDVEAETVRGQIKTRSAHVLRLTTDGDRPHWQVQTTVTVTPRWAEMDRFTVRMPPGCEFDDDASFPLPERVRNVSYDKTSRVVEFTLSRGGVEPSLLPFTVKVEGTYSDPVDLAAPGRVSLTLPRPLGTIEQDGSLTVQTPASIELLPGVDPPDGLELLRQTPHERSWRCPRRAPDRVETAWRPYHPPVSVTSQADVTLTGREGQVQQELHYELSGTVPHQASLLLGVPPAALNVQVKGGELVRATNEEAGSDGGASLYRLVLTDPQRPVFTLEYTFIRPDDPTGRIPIPLAVPHQTPHGQARVRVWSDGGVLLTTSAKGWTEQNIEEAPGRNRLPVLVLRSTRPDQALTLRSGRASAVFTVLMERALVRVEISDLGVQTYRVSYRLSRLTARRLDFELPAPLPTINLLARLDGRRIDPELLAVEALAPEQQPAGARTDFKGRLARLHLSPDLVRKPAILELSYQLAPDRTASTPISTTLQAPRPLGDSGSVPTRWQITAPPTWVVLAPEAGPGTARVWGRRGLLLAPRPKITGADLERWLFDAEPSAAAIEAADAVAPTLVVWRDSEPSLGVTHAPQQLWLVSCSLLLVLLGLGLARLPFARPTGGMPFWAWLAPAVLLAGLVLGVLLRPGLAGQIAYGCQPGVAVLLLIALVKGFLHERYRRQIVFLPSFSRSRSGSSLLRQEVVRPAHGEPSTVDAPRKSGSSIDRR